MTNELLKRLEKLASQEKWRKKPKIKEIVSKITETKKGNLKLKAGDETIYVLKKNKNLFNTAKEIKISDEVFVSGRRWLGKFYAEKLSVKKKEKEIQLKLTSDFKHR